MAVGAAVEVGAEAAEVGATFASVEDDPTEEVALPCATVGEVDETGAKIVPVEVFSEEAVVVVEEGEDPEGVDGGGLPVRVIVLACTTVFIIVVVDVETVVKGPVSAGSAKVSGEAKRRKVALKARLKRRIVMALRYGQGICESFARRCALVDHSHSVERERRW